MPFAFFLRFALLITAMAVFSPAVADDSIECSPNDGTSIPDGESPAIFQCRVDQELDAAALALSTGGVIAGARVQVNLSIQDADAVSDLFAADARFPPISGVISARLADKRTVDIHVTLAPTFQWTDEICNGGEQTNLAINIIKLDAPAFPPWFVSKLKAALETDAFFKGAAKDLVATPFRYFKEMICTTI